MTLAPGTRLGSYEVAGSLGAGGMGAVYRARDLDLGREVAIKVLSAAIGSDPATHARFEREARALAALNHPNVATLFGVERIGESRALVMELVEGDTLAEKIEGARGARGASLGIDLVLAIARQIAEALEAAHAKGIVHRDLKPANIKITAAGVVKVLDFGLAKAAGGAGFDAQQPTIDATRDGVIVGTASYMSPQQARGQMVGMDADIWAFGCVLFEMLAGRRAFPGDTIPDILVGVLQRDPDWSLLPAATPPAIVRLLRRCLAREPARRLRDIADARLEIEDVLAAPVAASAATVLPAAAAPARTARSAAIAAILLGVGVLAGVLSQRSLGRGAPGEPAATASVFGVSEPPGESLYLFADPVVLSPDGRQMALVTNGPEGQPRLWLRSLDDPIPKRVEAADGAMFPFWSPDGRSLAFSARGELRVMDLASRSVRTLVASPSPAPIFGGAWHRDGTILFADSTSGLKRLPAGGGEPAPVPSPGPSTDKLFVFAPQFLPDGRHFIYLAGSALPGRGAMMLGSLDSPERSVILKIDSSSRAVYAPPGFLIYVRGGDVVAHRFDASALTVSGDPVVIARSAWLSPGITALSVSSTGVLAFAAERTPTTQLTWFDRAGKPLGTLGEPGRWIHVALSPNDKAVAAERLDERTGAGVTWTMDASRGAASRLSLRPGWTMMPVWSPRGDRIALAASGVSIDLDLVIASADGSGRENVVLQGAGLSNPTDWLPDEGALVFNTATTTGASDVFTVGAAPGGKPAPLVQTQFNEVFGRVSPDGRWLAYVSNESGREEVYVRQFTGGGRWRVSQTGGTQPRWRRDGRELFFVSKTNRIMAAAVAPGAAFDTAAPVELPIETESDLTGGRSVYDAAADAKRFLVIRRTTRSQPQPISVVLNWPSLVRP